MSIQTIRQRQAVAAYNAAQRSARSDMRAAAAELRAPTNVRHLRVVRINPPKPHLEDTMLGTALFIAIAIVVIGVVGVRFFHVFSGVLPS